MIKNTAGQHVLGQLNALTDGTPVTSGTTTVYVIKDGVDALGLGAVTHIGRGAWKYEPTQDETNGDSLGFQFVNPDAPAQLPQTFTTTLSVADNLLTQMTQDNGEGVAQYTANALSNMQAYGGGAITGYWDWNNDTTNSTPANGNIKGNNNDYSLITEFYLSTTTANGYYSETTLANLKVGDNIIIVRETDTSKVIDSVVISPIINNNGSFTVPVAVTSSSGVMDNNKKVMVQFSSKAESSAEIAEAVRVEMDDNSTKLDVSVSSRMATFTYTSPDNSGIANLVSNQGNWLTATGFATVNYDDTSVINAINNLTDVTTQEIWEYSIRELTASDAVTLPQLQNELTDMSTFDAGADTVIASNMVDVSGLSRFDPNKDSVTASNMVNISGLSTFNVTTDIVKSDNVKINGYTIIGDGKDTPFDMA